MKSYLVLCLFFSDTDDETKKYLKDNNCNFNIGQYLSPLFNTANQQQHQTILSFIEQLESAGAKDLIDAFAGI
ncbi:MAG: hypothetical protein R2836_03535 [Chitinophagales bacterium]